MSFAIFIDKAEKEMQSVANDYLFNRQYSKKDPSQVLEEANEKMFHAIKDRDFFVELYSKFECIQST